MNTSGESNDSEEHTSAPLASNDDMPAKDDGREEHSHHHHHVHFGEEVDVVKSNEIVVRQKGDNRFEIQLGFLQVDHTYEVTALLTRSYFASQSDFQDFEQDDKVVNIYTKFISLEPDDDNAGVNLKFNFKAIQDKVAREKLYLIGGGSTYEFLIVARVLGRGKGTPLLRNGIKSIAVEAYDETEESDWAGF